VILVFGNGLSTPPVAPANSKFSVTVGAAAAFLWARIQQMARDDQLPLCRREPMQPSAGGGSKI
jgi:hypothetical protein